jgi:translation initiation factor IF-1
MFALFALAVVLPAAAQDGQGKATAVQMQATATVTAVDQATRMLTLKTTNGKELTTEVPPEVKNLKQIKVGDVVTVSYTMALAFRLNPAKAVPSEATTAVATAKPGEKPAGVVGTVVTITARVEAIDLKENTVTFKGPRGKVRTVAVRDSTYKEMLKQLAVGDSVQVDYSEAVAITVKEGKK